MGIPKQPQFLAGIVEGFYGRPWSFETRMAYAEYLPMMGLDTYLYCPKADPFLRKRWHELWPGSEIDRLKTLSNAYSDRSLKFGVGLSPFALYKNYGRVQRDLLERKIGELNTLDAPLLAILFDDMPGDVDGLASRQCEIVADVLHWSSAGRVIVCPTYYSFDPVLEKYFGTMPQGYWPQLGKELATEVDVFWTGNQVCSDSVSVADIESAQCQLGRPLVLWDNYPVNDGAQRSKFLYGSKLAHREPGLGAILNGHLCNPMNQGSVSLRALQGLADLYGRGGPHDEQWLEAQWGEHTYKQLLGDIEEFQQLGLGGMGEARCELLAGVYAELPGAAASEVAAWLRGEYTFDPACLTD